MSIKCADPEVSYRYLKLVPCPEAAMPAARSDERQLIQE
jgi:hypothetical protein